MELLPLAPGSFNQSFNLLVSLIYRILIMKADLSSQERSNSILILQINFMSLDRRDVCQDDLVHFERSDCLQWDLSDLELRSLHG
jgi:hypothetical protein